MNVLKQLGYAKFISADIGGVQAELTNYLTRKRVLLLFDNVNSQLQVDLLLECCKGKEPGSLLLFTCRDVDNLVSLPTESKQQVELMGVDAAFWLVCEMAELGVVSRESDLGKTVSEVADVCKGLPLALQILGKSLRGDFDQNWKVR